MPSPSESPANSETIRLFVAVPLWGQFREGALPRFEEIRSHRWPLRWVKPENWHLTLQFLGDVPLSDVGSLADSMEAMLEPLSPFEIELAGLGAFPRVSKARVLWVGVDRGIENLKCLAQRVREGCITAGHPGDKRPFEGHLTLARAKAEPVSISVPPAIFKARWGNHQVDSISLVRSRLESGGPVYEILKEIPLGSSF